jgi:predicted 3-demethylubiquinone-9 3-methyltransferase (glyoxalase superfamily)
MAEQKIIPNLWFDGNAREAVEFYITVFPGSKVNGGSKYPAEGLLDFQKPLAGKDLAIEFNLAGHNFTAINAGPEFKPTPSISCFVNFDPAHDPQAREHLDEVWDKLIDGGEALMPLDSYPFSEYYGWVKDRYGYTWQLILTKPEGEPRPCIIPSLMFGDGVVNRAEEAVNFYRSVFNEVGYDAKLGISARYPEQTGPAREGSLMFADFTLADQWFAAMDAGTEQDFTFNEAISLSIACKDQGEIDYFWEKLSTVPEAEQCGWCKDKYGVSWQVVPANMEELMQKPDAFKHLMQMKKLVIADF